jgi:fatty-acyl-CoA synthase
VENVLVDHPAVTESAVVAVPHQRLGEVPVAYIRVSGAVTEAELDAHCRAQLANFKVPRRFIMVDDFPRTAATMRIQKTRLRDMAIEAGLAS